jgi:molybdenum cofactor synthesis domain-containing protein
MKATVLGIGTELVDGQIINKNGPWISAKLKDFGIQTTLHLVVPDERHLMKEAMETCARHSDLIFITGGLGPTSDDFTRDVVADWAGQPLEFHSPSWDHLSERLTSRGYTVKEIQRQQCYFPKNSTVLFNPEGTANAFRLQISNKQVFVLPGPPREIEAVWKLSVNEWLKNATKDIDRHITRKWDTMGVGESDVAVLVEEVLQGVNVEKGYRVHLPYVEVKLSFPESQAQDFEPYVQRITAALKHCLIARDGEDAATQFAKALEKIPSWSLCDQVSGTFLLNRILPENRKAMTQNQWSYSNCEISEQALLQMSLLPQDEHTCEVIFDYDGRIFKDQITSPYKTANMRERRQQYFAELALIFWMKKIKDLLG